MNSSMNDSKTAINGPRLLAGSEHFTVIEEPAYAPTGAGEHLYVEIEKIGLNTDQVAEALAKACGRKFNDIGYAGRKDRHATTRQWFSVHFGKDEQLAHLKDHVKGGSVTVLNISRHKNKIRLGHLAGNAFRLALAGVDGKSLTDRLTKLHREGVRNRFGSQRFGVNRATLRCAQALGVGDHAGAVRWIIDPSGQWKLGDDLPTGFRHGAEGRVLGALRQDPGNAKGALRAAGNQLVKLFASAAQSAIFNAVLEKREQAGLLHTFRVGDLGHTVRGAPFTVTEETLAEDNRRAAPGTLEAFATGPLPGLRRLKPTPEREAEERAWSAATQMDWSWFEDGGALESPGERRSLLFTFRSLPSLEPDGEKTWLSLSLPSGSYATEVLEQLGIAIPADRRG
jgi:tRNA pseudouridine13 synthase